MREILGALQRILLLLRACVFYIGFIVVVLIFGLACCAACFLPAKQLQSVAATGNGLLLFWLRVTCDIKVRITGRENIPPGPCVILCNHQSSWESYYLQWLLQPVSFVLKRELLWIPVFGWSLALLRPIAIKRSNPASAIRHIFKQGALMLEEGVKVVIYPEGTRMPPGALGKFKTGGAALAARAGVPVIPVSHNAGEHWTLHGFLKYPGIVRLNIGPALSTSNNSAREVTEMAHSWIDRSLK
ncbi:MAG: 1-acyl-sn-glycerol-3-phosphate acyltransferase [Porticoccaceae bacterium]|nr:1-acyl-sn-glycerol-3-phosphate acyltransferase [Porticoccaceae bacterium]